MQRLQCDLCGSVDIIKTDEDVYQCQYCGCKYTLEVAKRMLFGGQVTTKAVDFEITGGTLVKYNGEAAEAVIPDNVTVVGRVAFKDLKGLKSVTFPAGLTEIAEYAFYGCTGLTELRLPEGLKTIGYGAFGHCTGLTEVRFPAGLQEIGQRAFPGCTGLTELHLPEGLNTIGDDAFSGCTGLKEVYIPDGVQSDFHWAFYPCPAKISTSVTRKKEAEELRLKRRAQGLCQHCGAAFNGVFRKVCSNPACGRPKDY